MTFADKLKTLRKQAGISQEKLAEQIGVSRQAITKWETGGGIPDIDNMMMISQLFHISVNELFGKTINAQTDDYLFDSFIEYDIDIPKSYDIHLGSAHYVEVLGYGGEKLKIRLASHSLMNIQSDVKLKIDDGKNNIDVDMMKFHDMTETKLKEALDIFIQIPQKYLTTLELNVNAQKIKLISLESESIELDTKTPIIEISDIIGKIELDCHIDTKIICHTLNGRIEINQVSSTSNIQIPNDISFKAIIKGLKNSIYYKKDGQDVESFAKDDADNIIELNGIKSELVIETLTK